jgi:hypothetical protein
VAIGKGPSGAFVVAAAWVIPPLAVMRPTWDGGGKVAVIHAKLILIHKHNHVAKPVGMSTDLGEFHDAVLSSEQ